MAANFAVGSKSVAIPIGQVIHYEDYQTRGVARCSILENALHGGKIWVALPLPNLRLHVDPEGRWDVLHLPQCVLNGTGRCVDRHG